ncbi:MAG: ribokinase [bacterium]|nr:ribokinase [Candidatus Kapabacteria bacterium]
MSLPVDGHRSPRVVVVGSINIDYQIRTATLPRPGETVEGSQFLESHGGKGANQAIAIARLDAHTSLVARIGANGVGAINHLNEFGVDTSNVRVDESVSTGIALIVVDASGEKTITVHRGANERISVADVSAASDVIASADILMVQLEIPIDVVYYALKLGRELKTMTVLDPAPATALDDELLVLVDVIRPNATEAETLTGVHVVDSGSALRAAHELIRRGAGIAAVAAAGDGNVIASRDSEHCVPLFDVQSIDATGAGDAFAAALAIRIWESQPLQDAVEFASASAALATTAMGAQTALPSRNAVEAFLKRQRNAGGAQALKRM